MRDRHSRFRKRIRREGRPPFTGRIFWKQKFHGWFLSGANKAFNCFERNVLWHAFRYYYTIKKLFFFLWKSISHVFRVKINCKRCGRRFSGNFASDRNETVTVTDRSSDTELLNFSWSCCKRISRHSTSSHRDKKILKYYRYLLRFNFTLFTI